MADHDPPSDDEHETKFTPAPQKSISEYHSLDAHDASLAKWKASLGLSSGPALADPSDPRLLIIHTLGLEVENRPDITIDLRQPGALESLAQKPFVIKEGAVYRMKVGFRVQHQILSGLKYVQVVKKMGISHKTSEMIGSFGPCVDVEGRREYEKKFEADTAPSGMLARGGYSASSRFVDDDGVTHLKFDWSFEIKKDWQ